MLGIALPAPGDTRALLQLLEKLPSGTSELMCHPGYAASGEHSFSCAQRERELEVLTCPSVRAAISREDISLVSFSDVCR
jgi:predicted glycoside hydrolase/deacetylase ChbG (UPF0249 family)